jgi:hypothetical protein
MQEKLFETPILLIIFNRPDTTAEVFDVIKKVKPTKLFIAADGPRLDRPEEEVLCQKAKEVVINSIDWPCDVKTLFREKNLGCGRSVSGAITWFFDNVEKGIIIEDDCKPHLDFFTYCEILLAKYEYDDRVALISGDNFQAGKKRGDASYYFSAYNNIWGWASWRRVWRNFKLDVNELDKNKIFREIDMLFSSKPEKDYWKEIFLKMSRNEIDTWDYPFLFSIWNKKQYCILPNKNLVSNIGFGTNATHTGTADSLLANMRTEGILPLRHPAKIKHDKKADHFYFYSYVMHKSSFIMDVFYKINNKIRRIIK